MKKLSFAIKANMNKPPRIHVQSSDKKTTHGSFQANDCNQFTNWEQLSSDETVELKHYMNNLKAIELYFSTKALSEQKDFRMKLPISFIQAIADLSTLCLEEDINLDVYDAMISAAIQQLKVSAGTLSNEAKPRALAILQDIGLNQKNKPSLSLKTQAIFHELLPIHNKSEKLYQKAITLFDKDKSISPMTIEEISKGELSTSRWLITCAIDVLLEENPEAINNMLSDDDLLFLWAKPLIKQGHSRETLVKQIEKLANNQYLIKKLEEVT